jgi:hypothetical protein
MLRMIVFVSSLLCVSAFAAEKNLTAEQLKQTNQLVDNVEKECLAGSPVPENADPMVKKTLEWARDPENCRCIATRIRQSITPEVFGLNAEQFRQYLRPVGFKAGMECGAPVVKKRFASSCEELAAMLGKESRLLDCDCIRSTIGKISDQEWIESSLAQYNAYLEEKKTGKPRVKPAPGPVDSLLEQCLRRDLLPGAPKNL